MEIKQWHRARALRFSQPISQLARLLQFSGADAAGRGLVVGQGLVFSQAVFWGGTERCPEGEEAMANTDLRQFTKDCREI